jgi:hypothetical protein
MLWIGLGAYYGAKKSPGWAVAGALGGTLVAGLVGYAIQQYAQPVTQVQQGYGAPPKLFSGTYSIVS